MNSRMGRLSLALASLSLVILPFVVSAAHAAGIEDLQDLAEPDYSGGAPGAPEPAITPALVKFFANAAVNGTIANGVCPGLDDLTFAAYCSGGPTKCFSFTVTGNGAASAPSAKPSVNACMTFEDYTGDIADLCFRGVGNATLSATSGASIVFALAGETCFAQRHASPAPTSARFNTFGTYMAESGTGPYATATGSGNFAFTELVTPLTSIPFAGPGQFSMTGNVAK
jgi:hypothetical protein